VNGGKEDESLGDIHDEKKRYKTLIVKESIDMRLKKKTFGKNSEERFKLRRGRTEGDG